MKCKLSGNSKHKNIYIERTQKVRDNGNCTKRGSKNLRSFREGKIHSRGDHPRQERQTCYKKMQGENK